MIRFECPNLLCRRDYEVPDEAAGKLTTCLNPDCQRRFRIPSPEWLTNPPPIQQDRPVNKSTSDVDPDNSDFDIVEVIDNDDESHVDVKTNAKPGKENKNPTESNSSPPRRERIQNGNDDSQWGNDKSHSARTEPTSIFRDFGKVDWQNGTGSAVAGAILVAFGLLVCLFFLVFYDTSVESLHGRVFNLGLLSQQRSGTVFGAALIIAGAIMFMVGQRR